VLITLAALAAGTVWQWGLPPIDWLLPAPAPHMGLDEAATAIIRGARMRTAMELLVIVFQVAGVAALGVSRLVPLQIWAELGRRGFTAAMGGLGFAGTYCAFYGSHLALFAGATMAVLLNIVIIWTNPAATSNSERVMSVQEPRLDLAA
jgi:hypothetical protein